MILFQWNGVALRDKAALANPSSGGEASGRMRNCHGKDVLSAFHAHGVKYLVVGGFAVIYHSQPRFTKDVDPFIKADIANAEAIYAALAEFGAPLEGTRPGDFTDRNSSFRFGRDPKGFDIVPAIPG